MKFLPRLIAYLISFPARIKGMKFGRNSYIGPGYDFLFVDLHNVSAEDNVMIGKRAWIQTVDLGKITIGSETHIGRDVVLSARNDISIGKNCLLSYRVSILDHDHKLDTTDKSPMKSGLTPGQKVTIGNNCFIGANVIITKGVMLGDHCVVGANSVVTKSFPQNSFLAGNPAKLLKKLSK